MKTFIALFVCFVAVLAMTDEQKEKVIETGKKCTEETGIDKELVQQVRGGDYSSNDPSLNTFKVCMMKKMGIIDASGNLNKKVILDMFDDDEKHEVEEVIDQCLEKTPFSEDSAYQLCKCFHIARPNHQVI